MNMTPEQLKARTKRFALEIIALVSKLPRTLVAEIIARQLVRCATSVQITGQRVVVDLVRSLRQRSRSFWKRQMRRCTGLRFSTNPASLRKSRCLK